MEKLQMYDVCEKGLSYAEKSYLDRSLPSYVFSAVKKSKKADLIGRHRNMKPNNMKALDRNVIAYLDMIALKDYSL